MKKLITLLLIVCLVGIMTSTLYACNGSSTDGDGNDENVKKNAIIITHGIGQGCLYYADTNQPTPYCISSLDSEGISALLADNGSSESSNLLDDILGALYLDENCVSTNNLRGTTMDDPTGQYAMLSLLKPLCDSLQEAYGDKYDILCWGYDWRMDNRQAAKELEDYINAKGYEKVILMGHSMGGNIVADYLSRSAENRNKCALFVPVGSPFFGSADTYYFMYRGIFPNLTAIMKGSDYDFLSNLDLDGMVQSSGVTPQLLALVSNCPSLYQIFPSEAYFEDPNAPDTADSAFCYEDMFYDYTETLEYFAEYEYSSRSDGSAKAGLADLPDYHASNYVEVDGKPVHVTKLVRTEYIVGTDCLTPFGVGVTENGDEYEVTCYNYYAGDAIVSAWSASAGTSLDADNVHVFSGRTHLSIITDSEMIATVVRLVGTVTQ